MYFTDKAMLPEYMDPLIITAAPYGPQYLPGDCDLPCKPSKKAPLKFQI